MLMSVPQELTTVMSMLNVTTLREVSFAPATLATLEMGLMEAVVVSFSLCNPYTVNLCDNGRC